MKKQFVTLDIAKSLKYIGFNEPCLAYYTTGSNVTLDENGEETNFVLLSRKLRGELVGHGSVKNSLFVWLKSNDKSAGELHTLSNSITAPLWQQVIDWFIEKHGIQCSYGSTSETNDEVGYTVIKLFKGGYNRVCADLKMNCRCEAREQAILKAIEIVEKKLRDESANFGNLLYKPSIKLNIFRKDLYEYDKPIDRTRKRLMQMADMGMEETGFASFGVRDIMSGLYIEMVWSYDDEKWDDYINWVKELVIEKTNV